MVRLSHTVWVNVEFPRDYGSVRKRSSTTTIFASSFLQRLHPAFAEIRGVLGWVFLTMRIGRRKIREQLLRVMRTTLAQP
jgi:hypothetical protein